MKTNWPLYIDWLCYKKGESTVEYESVEFPELHVSFDEDAGTWKAIFRKAYTSGRWTDELDVMPVLENAVAWVEEIV